MGVELAEHGRWYEGTGEHKGIKFKRVTTCLNTIRKPQLESWQEQQIYRGMREAIQAAPPPVIAVSSWADELEARVKAGIKARTEETTSFGIRAHDLARRLSSPLVAEATEVYNYDSDLDGVRQAWVKWHGVSNIEIDETEKVVYSEQLLVAGTIDFVGHDEHGIIIGDYKTGGIWADAAYQLAAYALLLKESGVQAYKGIAIHLDRDGTFFQHEVDNLEGEPLEMFLASRRIAFANEKLLWK